MLKYFLSIVALLFVFSCHRVQLEDWSSRPISYQFINLKSAVDRRLQMESQFKLANLKYSVIEAVLGRELTSPQLDELVSNGILDRATRENGTLTPGQIGIYLSYITRAFDIAKSAADNEIIVTFEDDVAIPPNVDAKFRSALQAVPSDWDILYLGCNQNQFFDVNSPDAFDPYFPHSTLDSSKYIIPTCPIDNSQRVYGTPWVQLDENCIAGAWALAVHPTSAKKLLRALVPASDALDIAIQRLVGRSEIRAYCLSPELIQVDLSSSTTKPTVN